MRRIGNILISLTLAFTVIALGAGVAFVRCCHTSAAELAQLQGIRYSMECGETCASDHYHDAHGCACQMSSGCMDVTVLKLAPTNITQHHLSFLQPIPAAVTLVSALSDRLPSHLLAEKQTRYARDNTGMPPRRYLRIIRKLQI